MNADVEPGSTHPSAQELAAYLERTDPAPARDVVEAHLALCDRCLSDLIAAGRVLRWYDAERR